MEHLSHYAVMESCLLGGTWQAQTRERLFSPDVYFPGAEYGSWHSLFLEYRLSLSMLSSPAWRRVLRGLLQYNEITGRFAAEAMTSSQQCQRSTLRTAEGKTLVKFLR